MMHEPEYTLNPDTLEAVMTYTLDAPRTLVWRTHTDPELIPQWWGPATYTTVVEKMEVFSGGAWRFIQYDQTGRAHPFSGKYLQVTEPSLLVHTFRYEPYTPPITHTEKIEFIALADKRTKIVTTSTFASLEDLETMVRDDMQEGATESYKRQIQLLIKLMEET